MNNTSQASQASTQAKSDEKVVLEAGFHIVPTVAEADVTAIADSVRTIIEKAGGSVISSEMPKRMPFAYRIERSVAGKREKYTEGYFGWIKFEAEAGAAKAVEHALRDLSEILRFMVIRTTREAITYTPRAVFASNSLEGKTIEKPAVVVAPEEKKEVSETELDKTIESLVE
ncbi:MAG TPA: 30S ribosomal protein S6 [Candidatus Paceibacterota bacterium]